MNFKLICIGKTTDSYVIEGIGQFEKRLKHYINYQRDELAVKSKVANQALKDAEGEKIISEIKPSDYLILLDEKGSLMNSVKFAGLISQRMNEAKNVVFVIGGAYGFSKKVYDRANLKLSLSPMTFPHQLVRLFFVEQLYRACTILKNEKYHH